MNASAGQKPHSAEYFGAQRNHWWNLDFLELMAQRWRLAEAKRVLDVGCGVGHWTRLVATFLPDDAQVTGIDREAAWVDKATHITSQGPGHRRIVFQQAAVENLPFADGSFDVVTCQTVLIHVHDVRAAMREMVRVLKPGGLLCVVEPNNMARALATEDVVEGQDMSRILGRVELQLTCERGKYLLGEGHNSIGEYLPRFFHEMGLQDMHLHMSDKAFKLVPPYSSPSEMAELKQSEEWVERSFWIWSLDETRAYFLAGGGDAARFETLWSQVMADEAAFVENARRREAYKAGGCMTYLVSGRKP
jgi:SAM-dependent methyltransferase